MAVAEKRLLDDLSFNCKHVLLDIEGTTTSISFVKDTLFPYVRQKLEEYFISHWDEEDFKSLLALLKNQAIEDKKADVDGVVEIPSEGSIEDQRKAAIKNVLWQMDSDRKTTVLKKLQGHMWRQGYKSGELQGHVYADVVPSLREWVKDGRKLYVYSSGSVEAQKLLFTHSTEGDLTELFTDFFDTEIGAKVDANSYKAILEKLSCNADDVLFLTDMPREASAARQAGVPVVLVEREGNESVDGEVRKEFSAISSFQDLAFDKSTKKPKMVESSPKNMSEENGHSDDKVTNGSTDSEVPPCMDVKESCVKEPSAIPAVSNGISSVANLKEDEAMDVENEKDAVKPSEGEESKAVEVEDKTVGDKVEEQCHKADSLEDSKSEKKELKVDAVIAPSQLNDSKKDEIKSESNDNTDVIMKEGKDLKSTDKPTESAAVQEVEKGEEKKSEDVSGMDAEPTVPVSEMETTKVVEDVKMITAPESEDKTVGLEEKCTTTVSAGVDSVPNKSKDVIEETEESSDISVKTDDLPAVSSVETVPSSDKKDESQAKDNIKNSGKPELEASEKTAQEVEQKTEIKTLPVTEEVLIKDPIQPKDEKTDTPQKEEKDKDKENEISKSDKEKEDGISVGEKDKENKIVTGDKDVENEVKIKDVKLNEAEICSSELNGVSEKPVKENGDTISNGHEVPSKDEINGVVKSNTNPQVDSSTGETEVGVKA